MSKPWRPDDELALLRQRRARASRPAGATVGAVLVGAACLGVAAGLYDAVGPRPPAAPEAAIEWNAVAAVPKALADPDDAEWEARASSAIASDGEASQAGLPRPGGARSGAVRASFGACKWGGGTNCVVDGDTFWIRGQKVRIADIDAPETHDYRCAAELALGERAARDLQALLNSGAVTMTHIDRNRDVYGRLLRNVAVNGQDVGETLILDGVARAYAGGRRSWC